METVLIVLVIGVVIYLANRIYVRYSARNDIAVGPLSAPGTKERDLAKRLVELSRWFENAYAVESPGRRTEIFTFYLSKTGGNKLAAYELAYLDYLKDLDRGR